MTTDTPTPEVDRPPVDTRIGRAAHSPARRPRLGRPRLLIVGCGDVGSRIVSRLAGRFRIFATTRTGDTAAALRSAGAVPMIIDLDQRARMQRLAGLARHVWLLAPTSVQGTQDRRSAKLMAALGRRRQPARRALDRRASAPVRWIYVSTTGVYGNRLGAWVDETSRPEPRQDRARRRLDAENRLRRVPQCAIVLRVPGIYAHDRLPLERLAQGLPVPPPEEDVYTNHIHAEDLARLIPVAAARGARARVYNATDDTELKLGDYLDLVARHAGLAPPPRVARSELARHLDAPRLSFMGESRRIRNDRIKRELRFRLAYPTVADALAHSASIRATIPGTVR